MAFFIRLVYVRITTVAYEIVARGYGFIKHCTHSAFNALVPWTVPPLRRRDTARETIPGDLPRLADALQAAEPGDTCIAASSAPLYTIDSSELCTSMRRRQDAQEEQMLLELNTANGRAERTRFTLPMMRLPRKHKAAFTSTELFAQQSNIDTHDYYLQIVLTVLHAAITQVFNKPVDSHYDFTMNFSGATSEVSKRFSVNMRSPVGCKVELRQTIRPDGGCTWQLVHNGNIFDVHVPLVYSASAVQPVVRDMTAPQDIQLQSGRVIDLD